MGCIEFHRVVLIYRPGLPPALREVSFTIRGGEKVSEEVGYWQGHQWMDGHVCCRAVGVRLYVAGSPVDGWTCVLPGCGCTVVRSCVSQQTTSVQLSLLHNHLIRAQIDEGHRRAQTVQPEPNVCYCIGWYVGTVYRMRLQSCVAECPSCL